MAQISNDGLCDYAQSDGRGCMKAGLQTQPYRARLFSCLRSFAALQDDKYAMATKKGTFYGALNKSA